MTLTWSTHKLPLFPTVVYEGRDRSGTVRAQVQHHDAGMPSEWAHASVGGVALSWPALGEAEAWVAAKLEGMEATMEMRDTVPLHWLNNPPAQPIAQMKASDLLRLAALMIDHGNWSATVRHDVVDRLGKLAAELDISPGHSRSTSHRARISASRTQHHEYLFRVALLKRGLSLPEWAQRQKDPGLSEHTAKSWLKGRKGGRPVPRFWAIKIAAEFIDEFGESEVPAVSASWPNGIFGA